ncbi:MAG TPA: AbrB/MazE/SpoVT family DNA-binding domain-containing protein [Thermoplasmata archaeon]|nr:AbrB/MazE/SpoVT family DNA-binding domain-containing protein [Thermoplasmata archaeon]
MAYVTPSRERRVLKAGHSSIAVTLPKPWAEAMNLRPGDIVVFDQNDDGTLYLKPAPTAASGVPGSPYLVQARAFEAPGVLTRLVEGAYRVGHDAIEIRAELPLAAERFEELQAVARGLLGVSIVAQESNRVVLQNFIDPSKYGLPQLVQRMKMILIAFLDESEDIVRRRAHSKRLPSLQEETHKVLSLLIRQLFLASRDWSLARRIGSPDPRQLLEWRVVVQSLEELGELLGRIATELNRAPASFRAGSAILEPLLGDLRSHLKVVVEALMRPSLQGGCEAHGSTLRLRETISESAPQWASTSDRHRRTAICHSLERGAACLTTLASVAIDRAVAVGSETVLIETG